MRLQSIRFAENENTPQEWTLEGLSLGSRNLIVGKNASGKSRTISVIFTLARQLAGLTPPNGSNSYDCIFSHGTIEYRYQFQVREQVVITEKLTIANIVRLDRGAAGEGTIFAEEIEGGKDVRFQTPINAFAAVMRRDSIQHKFLEPLYEWASSLRYYPFGSFLGKDIFSVVVPLGAAALDERDPNAVVPIFRQANKEYGSKFIDALKADLAKIDYPVSEIGTKAPTSIKIVGAPGEIVSLYVHEQDLPGTTDQHSMSMGMFRVLALLVHLNYYELKKSASCLMVDDVGEGLDFDRSCELIDLLREKSEKSDLQLILSTNDRFVMNRVPLEEWSVLQRKANHVSVRNYANSKVIFEDFKFTGLSNFSFLEMDLINAASSSPAS